MKAASLRFSVVALAATTICLPFFLLIYQSVLSEAFFVQSATFSLEAFRFIFTDPEFWTALRNSLVTAAGMMCVAVPIGCIFAFLVARTDLPYRSVISVGIILPMLTPSVILAFGYIVAAGPVGFYSLPVERLLGFLPWSIYSPWTIVLLAGFSTVPYVYIYALTALNEVSSDVEEAARVSGAGPIRVALQISLPLVTPAVAFSAVMIIFIGVELFGLPLVLGSESNFDMLSVYLYKLSNRFGAPSYSTMAAVVMLMVALTFPLVLFQKYLVKSGDRFVSIKGKASQRRRVRLGLWRVPVLLMVLAWIFVVVVVPISGIALRALVDQWGYGVNLWEELTLAHLNTVFAQPNLLRGVVNTAALGIIGGFVAVCCYLAIALSLHGSSGVTSYIMDHLVLVPRAIPGLALGLAFLWVFLFVPGLTDLRATLFSVWLAYSIVWLSYGLRLISTALMQISPELEEAARTCGAGAGRAFGFVTLPLLKRGLLSAWLLIFLMFEREYATGVYLLTSGNEVIGSLLVSLSESGAMDMVAALSLVNIALIGIGLVIALRFGIRLDE